MLGGLESVSVTLSVEISSSNFISHNAELLRLQSSVAQVPPCFTRRQPLTPGEGVSADVHPDHVQGAPPSHCQELDSASKMPPDQKSVLPVILDIKEFSALDCTSTRFEPRAEQVARAEDQLRLELMCR